MQKIKTALKNKNFDHLYFFHGDETFLSAFYVEQIRKALVDDPINYIKIDADDLSRLQEAVEDAPVKEKKSGSSKAVKGVLAVAVLAVLVGLRKGNILQLLI